MLTSLFRRIFRPNSGAAKQQHARTNPDEDVEASATSELLEQHEAGEDRQEEGGLCENHAGRKQRRGRSGKIVGNRAPLKARASVCGASKAANDSCDATTSTTSTSKSSGDCSKSEGSGSSNASESSSSSSGSSGDSATSASSNAEAVNRLQPSGPVGEMGDGYQSSAPTVNKDSLPETQPPDALEEVGDDDFSDEDDDFYGEDGEEAKVAFIAEAPQPHQLHQRNHYQHHYSQHAGANAALTAAAAATAAVPVAGPTSPAFPAPFHGSGGGGGGAGGCLPASTPATMSAAPSSLHPPRKTEVDQLLTGAASSQQRRDSVRGNLEELRVAESVNYRPVVYKYSFRIPDRPANMRVFTDPDDRRIEAIARSCDSQIHLEKLPMRTSAGQHGSSQRMRKVTIQSPDLHSLEKCCRQFDDRFPHFYVSGGLGLSGKSIQRVYLDELDQE